jgi:hypothetical protein
MEMLDKTALGGTTTLTQRDLRVDFITIRVNAVLRFQTIAGQNVFVSGTHDWTPPFDIPCHYLGFVDFKNCSRIKMRKASNGSMS